MISYALFEDFVQHIGGLRKAVYRRLNILKNAGVDLEDVAEEVTELTGVQFTGNVYGLFDNFAHSSGSRVRASAFFYWFHYGCHDTGHAAIIDNELFGRPLADVIETPDPGDIALTRKAPGRSQKPAIFTHRPLPTSKRYDDCEPLRWMARYVSGTSEVIDDLATLENFFEAHPRPPSWFEVASLPKEYLSKVLWSATNTLSHAVADRNMLALEQIDHITRFLHDYSADIPDAQAPRISNLLAEIRSEMIPASSLSDYAHFRFGRTRKPRARTRRLRMIQRGRLGRNYEGEVDVLYNQHETALYTLERTRGDLDEQEPDYDVEMAMALSSVIHALAIDPGNEMGIKHPFILDWREQIADIADRQPRALIHFAFSELQLAVIDADEAALKPKLDELMERFVTTGVAHLPLYEALQLGRRALDTGFNESAEARKLFSRPVEEQVRFMTRCNVGIIPALRDRFVEHHVLTRSEIRSNVLARFGSVMR